MQKAEYAGSHATRASARGRLGPGLVSIITLVALLLRLPQLGSRSLWVDEAMSVVFATKPLPELFHLLVTEDIHPPLYPLLLHYWMMIAGTSELAARIPSLIFGVLLVPLLYATASELESIADPKGQPTVSLVGLAAAVIAATSAYYIGYSQEARNYMAVTFLGLLSSYLLLRASASAGWKGWIGYGVATAAALYTHYTAFLLLIFHLLFVLLIRRAAGLAVRRWALTTLIVGLAYLPWLGYSIGQLERISDYWPGTLQLDAAVRTSLLLFVAGGGAGQASLMAPVLLGLGLLLAGLLALMLGGSRKGQSTHALFLLLYLTVPTALIFAIAYYRPKFDPRYLLVASPAFYLTLAWGIASLLRVAVSRRALPLFRLLLPCLGAAALTATVAASAIYGEPAKLTHVGDGRGGFQEYGDYRALVAYLEAHSQPGDAVALMMNSYHPYVYYSKLHIPWYPMEPFDDFDGAIILLNRIAEKHSRIWFILWQKEWADPTDYVMHVMETQAKEVPLDASFGGIGLRLFELIPGQKFSYYPRVDHKKEALFGGRMLEFWGWNVSSSQVAAGGSVQFDLHWRPLKKVSGKLKTKIMLADGELHLWAVVDEVSVSPLYPPTLWREQEILHDRHKLTVPAGVPPGEYQLLLLLYDENTMKELPIERWSGQSLGNILSLGTMAVTPTPQSAFPPATQSPLASWQLDSGRVELLRSRVSCDWTRPGDRIELELLWRAPQPPAAAKAVRVALLDEQGKPIVEQASDLVPGYPASRWRAGEPVLSRHWLGVPPILPPGSYWVAVAITEAPEKPAIQSQYALASHVEVRGRDQPGPPPGQDRVPPLP